MESDNLLHTPTPGRSSSSSGECIGYTEYIVTHKYMSFGLCAIDMYELLLVYLSHSASVLLCISVVYTCILLLVLFVCT